MPVLETKLNPRSSDFSANVAAMQTVVDDLNAKVTQVEQGGGEAARAKHTARGKLLPRDRVQMLLDPGTPFLELSPLAALGMYPDRDGTDSAPSRSTCARRRLPSKTSFLVFTWWIRAVPICPTRMKCSRTVTTLAASSLTRPT